SGHQVGPERGLGPDQGDPAGGGALAEPPADHEHQQQRADQGEEAVGAVAQVAAQLGGTDRERGPHAVTPRYGTRRESSTMTTAKPAIVSSGTPTSARPPPPAVIPSPRMNAATGLRSNRVDIAPEADTGMKAPPAMPSVKARMEAATPACS